MDTQFAPLTEFEISPTTSAEVPTGLSDAIKEHGVSAPLMCRRNPANGKLSVLVGVPRFHAAVAAGMVELPYQLIAAE